MAHSPDWMTQDFGNGIVAWSDGVCQGGENLAHWHTGKATGPLLGVELVSESGLRLAAQDLALGPQQPVFPEGRASGSGEGLIDLAGGLAAPAAGLLRLAEAVVGQAQIQPDENRAALLQRRVGPGPLQRPAQRGKRLVPPPGPVAGGAEGELGPGAFGFGRRGRLRQAGRLLQALSRVGGQQTDAGQRLAPRRGEGAAEAL